MSELTIIAVHGNGGGGFRFARMEPFVPQDVRLRAVTLPGFAGEPYDPQLRTLRDYANRLRQICLRECGPRVLLGHGIGGSIVLELLQHAPETVDGVILHAPVGARLDRRWFPRLMKAPAMRELGRRMFTWPLLRPFWSRLLFSQPVPADYLDRFFREYRQCQVFALMFDLISPEWFASLRPVGLPAVLLWGARERVLTADQMDDFLHLLPDCRQRIVPHWDHFPMIEQPQEYAAEIVRLARSLAARAVRS